MELNGNGLEFNLIPAGGMSQTAIDGFQAAANLWSAILRDDIRVNININFTALGPGILGSTGSASQGNNLSSVRTALTSDAKSLSDQTAVANLPTGSSLSLYTSDATSGNPELDNNGSPNNTVLDVNTANAKALGLRAANDGASDGSITFSNQFTWDFDRSNGISAGAFDFVGVAAHEIGHLLGFVSGADIVDVYSHFGPGAPLELDPFDQVVAPLDLFRYSTASEAAGANIDIRADTATKYFSIDGGTTQLTTYSTGTFNGDGSQCSHWKDNLGIGIMDPTGSPQEFMDITDLDVRAMDVIGWDVRMDLGDAPDTGAGTGSANYSTNLSDNGPRHLTFKASGLITDQTGAAKVYLGSGVTSELTAQQNGTATGDTDNGIASFPTFPRGTTQNITVTSTGGGAKLNYFFDFNQDGDFADAGESFSATLNTASQSVPVTIPGNSAGGNTFARFRISTAGGLTSVGPADDGEVEDYQVTIANTPPVAQPSSVTTNEDTAKAFAVSDFLFTDAESDGLASITVSGLNLAAGDTLKLSGTNVTLNQTISAANFPNLVYTPALNANGSGRSWFDFKVNDSSTGTVAATMTINVTAVNDPPVAQASSVTTNEDTAKAFAVSDFQFTDVESDGLASITISSLSLAAGDTLKLSGSDVTTNQTITAANIPNLVYMPVLNANGNGRSSFNFRVNDSASGTVAATMTINVTPVNDVPVAQPSSVTTNEDMARLFAVANFQFTDVESNSLGSITISSLSLAPGDTLQLSGVDVTPNQPILATNILNLVYTPAPNANGAGRSSFDFSVNDSGNGTVGATMTINVTPVNDAPVAQASNVATTEDTPKAFAASNFLFTDVEGNNLASITISNLSLATGDTLQLSGVDVTANQTISAANIPNLVYSPALNANGAGRSSFNFRVNDSSSGTVAATMTIDVGAFNDVPVAQASSVTTDEDTARAFAVSDFLFTDVEGDGLASITITSLNLAPGDTLQFNGVNVAVNDDYLAVDISNVFYMPALNANGAAHASFDFIVNDADSGTVAATMTINVTPVNDAPVIDTSFTPMLPAIAMPQPKNAVIAGTSIAKLLAHASDVDPDATGIAVTGYDASRGQWQYSTDSGANWTVFPAVSDDAALALANDGLTQIRFLPNKAAKGVKAFTKGFADLTFRAWDQTDGATPVSPLVDADDVANTAYGLQTEHAWVAVGKTAPVVDVEGHPVLKAIPIPKVAPKNPKPGPSYTVKSFLGLLAKETDSTKVFGIAVSGASGTGILGTGEWQYNTGKGGWKLLGAVDDSAALLLRPKDRVRFLKGPTFDGHADLTYHTWDMTSESFGTYFAVNVPGFSLATETAIANAAPILTPAHPSLGTILPGSTTTPMLVSALIGAAATDVEQSNFGMYVSAPRGGTWEYSLNGTDWIKVTKAVYLSSTAQLRFTAAVTAKVGSIASLTFKAWDQTLKSTATLSKVRDKITVTIG